MISGRPLFRAYGQATVPVLDFLGDRLNIMDSMDAGRSPLRTRMRSLLGLLPNSLRYFFENVACDPKPVACETSMTGSLVSCSSERARHNRIFA